jgi:hypothetical protein
MVAGFSYRSGASPTITIMVIEVNNLDMKLLGEDCPICLFPLGEEPG